MYCGAGEHEHRRYLITLHEECERRCTSAPLRDLLDAPTALAACCGFGLCHKYILYLYLCTRAPSCRRRQGGTNYEGPQEHDGVCIRKLHEPDGRVRAIHERTRGPAAALAPKRVPTSTPSNAVGYDR